MRKMLGTMSGLGESDRRIKRVENYAWGLRNVHFLIMPDFVFFVFLKFQYDGR